MCWEALFPPLLEWGMGSSSPCSFPFLLSPPDGRRRSLTPATSGAEGLGPHPIREPWNPWSWGPGWTGSSTRGLCRPGSPGLAWPIWTLWLPPSRPHMGNSIRVQRSIRGAKPKSPAGCPRSPSEGGSGTRSKSDHGETLKGRWGCWEHLPSPPNPHKPTAVLLLALETQFSHQLQNPPGLCYI